MLTKKYSVEQVANAVENFVLSSVYWEQDAHFMLSHEWNAVEEMVEDVINSNSEYIELNVKGDEVIEFTGDSKLLLQTVQGMALDIMEQKQGKMDLQTCIQLTQMYLMNKEVIEYLEWLSFESLQYRFESIQKGLKENMKGLTQQQESLVSLLTDYVCEFGRVGLQRTAFELIFHQERALSQMLHEMLETDRNLMGDLLYLVTHHEYRGQDVHMYNQWKQRMVQILLEMDFDFNDKGLAEHPILAALHQLMDDGWLYHFNKVLWEKWLDKKGGSVHG